MAQLFEANGYTVVPAGQEADVYIVNSCTVTNFGDQKAANGCAAPSARTPAP